MNKYVLIAAIASGLVMGSGVSTVSADQGLQKLDMTQLDNVSAGYKRKQRRSHYKKPTAFAASLSGAHAYGNNTAAVTFNENIADSNAGYSGSISGGIAYASGTSYCYVCAR